MRKLARISESDFASTLSYLLDAVRDNESMDCEHKARSKLLPQNVDEVREQCDDIRRALGFQVHLQRRRALEDRRRLRNEALAPIARSEDRNHERQQKRIQKPPLVLVAVDCQQ